MTTHARADRTQLKIFYGCSLILIALDQLSKYWAQQTLRNQPPVIFWNDFFRFDYAENPGAFLGMGDSLSDPLRFWVFTILVFFLMVGLAVFMHLRHRPRLETWAYSLVFAGGIGNLIDRAFHANGRVVDFMNMSLIVIRTGIFNIADMAIMLGLVLLLFSGQSEKTAGPR
jgi:signal peptidase II